MWISQMIESCSGAIVVEAIVFLLRACNKTLPEIRSDHLSVLLFSRFTKWASDSTGMVCWGIISDVSSYRRRSPRPVGCENVVPLPRGRMARESALGIVPLRWLVGQCAGSEGTGCSVILEHAPSPPTTVREPLAIFQHEINVMLGALHGWLTGSRIIRFRVPMNLHHSDAIGKGLPLPGKSAL